MKRFLNFLFALCFLPSVALGATSEDRSAVLSVGTAMVSNGSINTFALTATTDWLEQVYHVTEAATVTQICYSYGIRTGTPPTYKIGIEGVSASTGRADTVYKTGTGECSATFTPPATTADDGHIVCKTLTGTTCTVARNDVIALTIRYSAGTISGANDSTFAYRFANGQGSDDTTNYVWTVTASVGTQSKGYEHIAMFYGNATPRYWGNAAVNYTNNTVSGTAERAMRFQVPGPVGQTFQLDGAKVWMSQPAAGESFSVKLYNGTTALETCTIDTDQMGNGNNPMAVKCFWPAAETLTFNTTYYIGVSGFTTGKYIVTADAYNNAYLDAWPLGIQTYGAHRATMGATAWTDDTNERPHVDLILNSIVSAGAAGGLQQSSGMNGGINN